MLSAEENRRLTEIGPGTPAGGVMRQFWQPAALVEELETGRPVKEVRLLGEELALFKTEQGGYGLIGKQCPHRGSDLCFGRLEDGGLRCPFHGWLFNAQGECLEQPAEPDDSRFHTKIRHTAYPCEAKNGIIFTYMGEGTPPPFPALDCFTAPGTHAFAFKGLIESNWLQALEVGIDPAHASFLHRFLEDEDPNEGYGKQFRDTIDDIPMTRLLREYPRPEINVSETPYGLQIMALRNLDNQGMHVRVTNQIFPHAICIPMSAEMTITQWHVPVDDVSCYWYAIFTSFDQPVDHKTMRAQRLELYELPDYVPRLNKSNNYGYNPKEQATKTYTGMGLDINTHDQWAVESPGPIQDRTREHLGQSDIAITAYRRLLRQAIAASEKAEKTKFDWAQTEIAAVTGPVAVDAIAPIDNWQQSPQAKDQERRAACPWISEQLEHGRG